MPKRGSPVAKLMLYVNIFLLYYLIWNIVNRTAILLKDFHGRCLIFNTRLSCVNQFLVFKNFHN